MIPAKPSGLRVVLDTNVYVSAFSHRQGAPFRVWQKAIREEYRLLISPAIIRELARVLREYFGWPEPDVIAALKLLVKVAQIITPRITLHAIPEDDADNRIVECAVAGQADL